MLSVKGYHNRLAAQVGKFRHNSFLKKKWFSNILTIETRYPLFCYTSSRELVYCEADTGSVYARKYLVQLSLLNTQCCTSVSMHDTVSFWYILWQSAWLPHLGLERCMHQQPLLGLRCANVHTNELLFVKNCLKMQWVSVAIQCTFEVVVPQTRLQRFHLLLCMIICFAYASQLIACITSASLSRRTNHYAFLIWVTCIENLTNGDVVRLIAFKALKLYIVALCTSTMYPHVFIVDHHADTRRIAHRDWRRLQCGSHVRCNFTLN